MTPPTMECLRLDYDILTTKISDKNCAQVTDAPLPNFSISCRTMPENRRHRTEY
ncbi:hypothetical protein BDN70DRAFT_887864 [Pholiota conissans]|uniref:Uncharacterized protein n=1 Tax=Pholiota conissans TaxID=109636 RepID=A0A9P6CTJ2_9AGAR|nr:hypothetical protein BDN70DRAFT_887864 [Pholiota conissans]